jgi:predicted restriction endonuclease
VVYDNLCAVRCNSYAPNFSGGLEAAHIHAKGEGGNFLPTNGILLSADLHRTFDLGLWTLTDDLRVMVHPTLSSGLLIQYNNKHLTIPPANAAFRPYTGYIQWHRENRYGKFLTIPSLAFSRE